MGKRVKVVNQEANELQMTPLMKLLKNIHEVSSAGDSVNLEDIKKQRASQDRLASITTLSKDIEVQELSIRGIPAEWVIPQFKHDTDRIILYCHGGGYTCGSLKYARIIASKLAIHCGMAVMSFEYALAPEHPYPAAIEDALVIWNYIMQLGFGSREVIVVGDSAGGNLALELLLKLKAQKRMMPKGLVLMSPWTDMTMSGDTYETCKDVDPMLSREYIQTCRYSFIGLNEKYNEDEKVVKIDEANIDYANPDFSPLFADLDGFPPTLIQVGSNEVLKADSTRLYEELLNVGVLTLLEEYEDAWHVFQMMPIRKSVLAMESVSRFIGALY